MARKILTESDKAFIKQNYLIKTGADIAIELGYNRSTINRYMRDNDIKPPIDVFKKLKSSAMSGRTSCTPEEDAIIREIYLITPQKRAAEQLGFSHTKYITRLRQLGLKIPEDIRKKFAEESRIKPGTISFNKGKKQIEYMSAEAIERTKASRFKKGNLPHNTKPDGDDISIRYDNRGKPYKFIRVTMGKWIALHTYKWEKKYGKLPAGHCLWFKDGDTLNPEVDNMELITRMENIKRNSGALHLKDKMIASYLTIESRKPNPELKAEILQNHPELIQAKRELILLNRIIKQKENGKEQTI